MEHDKKPDSGPVQDFLNAEEPRRDFFTQAAAVVTGAALGVVPLFAGLAVFTDPLRKRERKSEGGADADGFLKVAPLDGLLKGGEPRRYEVIDDRTDAWNLFPREAVGAVYLVRPVDGLVKAFNVKCPHAGCSVDFKAENACFQCPCHDSSFKPNDGLIANPNSPSPRGLDELEVKEVDGMVWVKYQEFQPGTSHKVPEA
ncbi:MAG: Rieske 2Fe-2S domain-containing protein [Planctomycetota bacterium]|nr:Rieske 2Fe-2S domain-containing protein [Planctomycetota bacterium]